MLVRQISLAMAVLITVISGNAWANPFKRVRNLAERVHYDTIELSEELETHFSHDRQLYHVLSDVQQFGQRAHDIEKLSRRHANRHVLKAQMDHLEDMYRHMKYLVKQMDRDAFMHGSSYDRGHVGHIDDLLHRLDDRMDCLEAAIFHLPDHQVHRRQTHVQHANHRGQQRDSVGLRVGNFTIRF